MIQVKINDDDRRYAVEILKTKNFGHRSRGLMVTMKNNTQV